MESSREQRMQTIDTLLNGYSSRSITKLLEPLAPNFHHHVLPQSLSMPIRDIDAFTRHAEGVFGVFEEFKLIPKTIIDDAATGMVAIHAQMLGTLKSGKGEWKNECMMMVRLTEDGRKVLDIKEFVDSAKALDMARIHAPKAFDGKVSKTANTMNSTFSLLDWAVMDSDSWIHVSAAIIALIGLRRILS
ncbi:hypothetical protein F4678DRAFT_456651 [Xylaria arbuscula]|nr:hypothetical protein F4678DRAFT_456651 [Xylaria arbuscula]